MSCLQGYIYKMLRNIILLASFKIQDVNFSDHQWFKHRYF